VSGIARSRDLLKIIFAENPDSAIIFCNTRDETTMVARFLQKQGLDAEPLSSDLSQADRERVMGRMKQHNLRFLCATDVAARGIDISDLSHVINYSVPEQPEIYVHRTGRTGRAGKKGTALSLVGPRELGNFRYVRLQFGIKPEERLLPKDEIFVGRLKVPLPPLGTPQPPDPVQILLRGIPLTGSGPTDLEMKIFEKLLATIQGKRVIAQLVAERLNLLTTRSRVVNSVPQLRAYVSKAICSVRMWSRESLIGRRKSYAAGPALPRRDILPGERVGDGPAVGRAGRRGVDAQGAATRDERPRDCLRAAQRPDCGEPHGRAHGRGSRRPHRDSEPRGQAPAGRVGRRHREGLPRVSGRSA